MDGWIGVQTDGGMGAYVDRLTDRWSDGWMSKWQCLCITGCLIGENETRCNFSFTKR